MYIYIVIPPLIKQISPSLRSKNKTSPPWKLFLPSLSFLEVNSILTFIIIISLFFFTDLPTVDTHK